MSPRAAKLMLTALYDAGVKLQLGRAVKKIGGLLCILARQLKRPEV